jgi:ribonuclease HI
MKPRKKITIYTDGACSGNPGPGGYGAVLICGDKRKELSGGYRKTTNNRMEILAAIRGLEALKSASDVTLYTDSRYLVDAVEKGWAERWQKNRWMRNKTDKASNVDLWKRMLALLELHRVTMVWVEGHAGNRENEHCDQLATGAIRTGKLETDTGYEPAE